MSLLSVFLTASVPEEPTPVGILFVLVLIVMLGGGALLVRAVLHSAARRSALHRVVVKPVVRAIARTPVGQAFGFATNPDRELLDDLKRECTRALAGPFVLHVGLGSQPDGVLLLSTPDDRVSMIRELDGLVHRVVEECVADAFADALALHSGRMHPQMTDEEKSRVRADARSRVGSPRVEVRYVTSYDSVIRAVFGPTADGALRRAREDFEGMIPLAARPERIPVRLSRLETDPSVLRSALGFDSETGDGAPPTRSAKQEPSPTRYASATPTAALSCVYAVLESGTRTVSTPVPEDQPLRIGRRETSDLVVPEEDDTVSGDHLVVTLQGNALRIEAFGRTGTWIASEFNDSLSRIDPSEPLRVMLPVSLVLGDARRTRIEFAEVT